MVVWCGGEVVEGEQWDGAGREEEEVTETVASAEGMDERINEEENGVEDTDQGTDY